MNASLQIQNNARLAQNSMTMRLIQSLTPQGPSTATSDLQQGPRDSLNLSPQARQNLFAANSGGTTQVKVEKWDPKNKNANSSLSSILRNQGLDPYAKDSSGRTLVQRVATANGLKNPNLIHPGQKLTVPTSYSQKAAAQSPPEFPEFVSKIYKKLTDEQTDANGVRPRVKFGPGHPLHNAQEKPVVEEKPVKLQIHRPSGNTENKPSTDRPFVNGVRPRVKFGPGHPLHNAQEKPVVEEKPVKLQIQRPSGSTEDKPSKDRPFVNGVRPRVKFGAEQPVQEAPDNSIVSSDDLVKALGL